MKTQLSALLTACILVSLAVTATAPVAGQGHSANATNGTASSPPSVSGERIDPATVLISSSYDADTGRATIVVRSQIPQQITISDAGAFVEGGQVAQQSKLAKPGENTTISLPVTKTADGYVGVSIATQNTLYAEPIQTQTRLVEGESTWQTVQIAALGGAVGVLVVAGLIAYRLREGGRQHTERVA